MTSADKIRDAVSKELARIGVTFTASHVGLVRQWGGEQDAWRVTFTKEGGKPETFDYFTGLGHRKVTFTAPKWDTLERNVKEGHTRPVAPCAADVLYSLLSDTESGLETFEEFCSTYGYDTDSRKALATYLACQENGTKIRRILGASYAVLAETVREL